MCVAQGIVKALDHERIALELADDRARVNVIHACHPHPFADHAEVHAMIFLARIG